ncbi:MAG: hypothetical protein AAF351_03530 [Pseudomonadota bacterium]
MFKRDSIIGKFFYEMRRRRTFRTGGLYIVGAWLVLQVADVTFPGLNLPESAVRVLLTAAVLGFPVALIFGWYFDITENGIVRTPPADADDAQPSLSLQKRDYLILAALVTIVGAIVTDSVSDLASLTGSDADTTTLVTATDDIDDSSIAVLPFVNSSANPDNDYFGDGISEELMHRLSTVDGLRVMGRNSSFAFRGSDYSITRIAQSLGVRYILQGSVRQEGNQLRIICSLVDHTGETHWSQSFTEERKNIFDIQAEIAEVVATTVAPQITPQIYDDYEPNIQAYKTYLKGRELVRRRSANAVAELKRAIDLDPTYALAHAEYAIAAMIFTRDKRDEARRAIDNALALAPGLPRAIAADGLYLQGPNFQAGDMVASERMLRRALDIEPNMIDAMNWLTQALVLQGKEDEANALNLRALRIDPLHGTIATNYATRRIRQGNYPAALAVLEPFADMPNPPVQPIITLRQIYIDTGQLTKLDALEKSAALRGDHLYFGLAVSYWMLGLPEASEFWIDQTITDYPDLVWVRSGIYDALIDQWAGRYSIALDKYGKKLATNPEARRALYPFAELGLGNLQGLAGKYSEAVATLGPIIVDDNVFSELLGIEAFTQYAFAAREIGAADDAARVVAQIRRLSEGPQLDSETPRSDFLYALALAAAIAGDREQAIDQLKGAIDAGWRRYYSQIYNPIWAEYREDPEFMELMQLAKSDADRQREVIEAKESYLAFQERFLRLREAQSIN